MSYYDPTSSVGGESHSYEQQQQQQPQQQALPALYDHLTTVAAKTEQPDGGGLCLSYAIASPILVQNKSVASLNSGGGGDIYSDTCPETPDSSVKEEAMDEENSSSNSPADVGPRTCLWQDCSEVFGCQWDLVEHVNEAHMETKKGSDDYPCMWQVSRTRF